jgi:type I site-specific restriction endonuclease
MFEVILSPEAQEFYDLIVLTIAHRSEVYE